MNYGGLMDLMIHSVEKHAWGVACGTSCCMKCEYVTSSFNLLREHIKEVHRRDFNYQLDSFELIILNDVMPVMTCHGNCFFQLIFDAYLQQINKFSFYHL